MTNEDQKNQNEKMNEDNLMAELDEFNSGSSQEAEEQPVEEQQADSQKAEEVQENQSDEKSDKEIPEEKNTEIEQWLIKNKFADDEEGKQKLVDAYRQLQSKSDKERNEWGSEKNVRAKNVKGCS